MITNQQVRIPTAEAGDRDALIEHIEKHLAGRALRWYISHLGDGEITVEATLLEPVDHSPPPATTTPAIATTARPYRAGKSAVVHIVPTGVGCEVGGYAGDAAPSARLLAHTADYLLTNPNAVNASSFIDLEPNILYTEGLLIDRFCRGEIDLHVPRSNRVGLIVERSTPEHLDVVYNVVNTARAVYGVEIVGVAVTEGAIGSRSVLSSSGTYIGTVDHPEEIDKACRDLLDRGAQAIGITTNIQDLPHDEYVRHFAGEFPNPMGGVEAIISHFIVHSFDVPAAHAPMINLKDLALPDRVVDARGAGEIASESGLACVLIGLARAPRPTLGAGTLDAINVHNLLAVVAPATCLGGIPTLAADRLGIPVIAVEDNATVLEVRAEKVGLRHVVPARSYAEASGFLLALRHGISLDSLRRPLATLRPERSSENGSEIRARIAETIAA